jgi:putative hydrolase of the HAD superfamily
MPSTSDQPALLSSGVQAVFFDAVGTILHPEPPAASVYASIGQRWGSRLTTAEVAPRFRAAFHAEEIADHQHRLRTSEAREVERWRHIVAQVLNDVRDPAACFAELFDHFSRPDAWRTDPEAAGVLATLSKRGFQVGVASNYDRRLRSVLAGLSELAGVQHLVISSEVGWRKPSPRFFAALVERTGLAPQQIALVGDDWDNDYEGARAAGLHAIYLDTRGQHPEAVHIRSLRELLDARNTLR